MRRAAARSSRRAESEARLAERTLRARGRAGRDRRQHRAAPRRRARAPRPGASALDARARACSRAPRPRRARSRSRGASSRSCASSEELVARAARRARGARARSTTIRAPAVATVVQTQLIWPGELAQPGTPVALGARSARQVRADLRAGRRRRRACASGTRVEIELDSEPGTRVPGEVSFVADQANFTPEKIETRSDRIGQVYRAKVRILEGVERFQPGTEGNVYLRTARRRPPSPRRAVHERDGRGSAPRIRLRGLRKRFGPRVALAGVDLELEGAGLVGVVGPDGAGKTTLLRALAGLLEVEADEARVLGLDLRGDVTRAEGADRLRAAGLRPAARALGRREPALHGAPAPARRRRVSAPRAAELLERTGLAPFADRPAGALSGGMKQKLAIANALLPQPGAPAARRADRRRRRRGARRDLGAARGAARRDADPAQHELPRRGRGAASGSSTSTTGRVVAIGTPAELRARRPARALPRLGRRSARHRARGARAALRRERARQRPLRARRGAARRARRARRACSRDLRALPGHAVRVAEQAPVDMETTLLALARRGPGRRAEPR